MNDLGHCVPVDSSLENWGSYFVPQLAQVAMSEGSAFPATYALDLESIILCIVSQALQSPPSSLPDSKLLPEFLQHLLILARLGKVDLLLYFLPLMEWSLSRNFSSSRAPFPSSFDRSSPSASSSSASSSSSAFSSSSASSSSVADASSHHPKRRNFDLSSSSFFSASISSPHRVLWSRNVFTSAQLVQSAVTMHTLHDLETELQAYQVIITRLLLLLILFFFVYSLGICSLNCPWKMC